MTGVGLNPAKLAFPKPTTARWLRAAEAGMLIPALRANQSAAIKFFGALPAMRENEAELKEIIYAQSKLEMSDEELLKEPKGSDDDAVDLLRFVVSAVENGVPTSLPPLRKSAFARVYYQDLSESFQRARSESKSWSPEIVALVKRTIAVQEIQAKEPNNTSPVQWMRRHAESVLRAARGV
jgi:hypothetical protein